jgi:hypothetical protein
VAVTGTSPLERAQETKPNAVTAVVAKRMLRVAYFIGVEEGKTAPTRSVGCGP